MGYWLEIKLQRVPSPCSYLYSFPRLFFCCGTAVGDEGEMLLLSHMFAAHVLYPQLEH